MQKKSGAFFQIPVTVQAQKKTGQRLTHLLAQIRCVLRCYLFSESSDAREARCAVSPLIDRSIACLFNHCSISISSKFLNGGSKENTTANLFRSLNGCLRDIHGNHVHVRVSSPSHGVVALFNNNDQYTLQKQQNEVNQKAPDVD